MRKLQNLLPFALAILFCFGIFQSRAEDSKTVWAIVAGQLDNQVPYTPETGIVSYDLQNPGKYTMLHEITSGNSIETGMYFDGEFYYLEYIQQSYGYDSVGLFAIDIETGDLRIVADYGNERQGITYCSMTYDYASEKVYALDGFMAGNGLVTVDLSNGEIKKVCKFTGLEKNTEYDSDDYFKAIACNYNGEMYGVSYWGRLYKIDISTGNCTKIGDLDFNPEKAIMYGTSLAFDNDTNELYWSVYTWVNLYKELRKINVNDATTEQIGIFEEGRLLCDFYIPFTQADASSPAKVSDLSLIPGEKGALTATLKWTNPSKTFGRGGTLESLTQIDIYRNSEKIHTITSPVIGGEEEFTDEVPANGNYSYMLIPQNEAGEGGRTAVSGYIGVGIPNEVTNVLLTDENYNGNLSWDAPTSARFDAYLDTETLVYEIVRYPDATVLASEYKETTFVDETIPTLGKYYYSITAKNSGGVSDPVNSESKVLGSAVEIPASFPFTANSELETWTILDNNANYGQWVFNYGWGTNISGARNGYNYDELAADDYLISPKIAFKAGKHYKLTFDVQTANKSISEILDVTFGDTPTAEDAKSLKQFIIKDNKVNSLRVNLPVTETDCDKHIGFYHTTATNYFSIVVGNIKVEEDHEGYLEGVVECNGSPIANALLVINDGEFTAVSDESGKYRIEYLPEATYTVKVYATGYYDTEIEASITELATTVENVEMTVLPEYKVSGNVVDEVGEAVKNAKVVISGYSSYETATDAEGNFTIEGVFQNEYYNISISHNKLVGYSASLDVNEDKNLGTITLVDNVKAPAVAYVEEIDNSAEVTWNAPANDPMEYRYDDGTTPRSVGLQNGISKSVFGHVNRTPSVLHSIDFYVASHPTVAKHYSVGVYVIDLNEEGEPTDSVLYYNSYVPINDDEWSSFTFPAPVDAPNGYMVGVAYSGFISLAIDGDGDKEKWPFAEWTNCYTPDYTTGEYYYLDETEFTSNFCLRSHAAPYEITYDVPVFVKEKRPKRVAPELTSVILENNDCEQIVSNTTEHRRLVEDRIRYNVYRMKNSEMNDESLWTELATGLKDQKYTDTDWSNLEQGVYRYGVKAVYAGDKLSAVTLTDSIGKNMRTKVNISVYTDTPVSEADNVSLLLTSDCGQFIYEEITDATGKASISDVWKTDYSLTVAKAGFRTSIESVALTAENEYDILVNLYEDKQTPTNPQIISDDLNGDERLFLWNFPDLLSDDFESHEDFTVDSPGEIGWQYVDGDNSDTGAFADYYWYNMFEPMAFIVFNPYATEPSMESNYNIRPYAGQKMLANFAASSGQNDDWLISPRLYFTEDFQFRFYCRSYNYLAVETIRVGYSETGIESDDFIWVNDQLRLDSWWNEKSFDIPASAKYVAIHNISSNGQISMYDNIRIGLASAMNTGSYAPQRMPSETGLYEIYLNGEKVADTDETQYLFTQLDNGHYTAGVRASYTSGYSGMATVDFDVTESGIEINNVDSLKVYVADNILHIEGCYDSVEMFNVAGVKMPLNGGNGIYDLSALGKGVYIVAVNTGEKTVNQKVVVK